MRRRSVIQDLDWMSILMFLAFLFIGWITIFAVEFDDQHAGIFDLSRSYGKQMIWVGVSIITAISLLIIDAKFYTSFAYVIYGLSMAALVGVLLFGTTIAGSQSWFEIGSFRLQPSEFAKFATALAMAKFISTRQIKLTTIRDRLIAAAIFAFPAALIIKQGDTGSAAVFAAFFFVMFREGMPAIYMYLGIAMVVLSVAALMIDKLILIAVLIGVALLIMYFLKKNRQVMVITALAAVLASGYVFAVDLAFHKVLKIYQQERIEVLLGIRNDPKGSGYNVTQSIIAIGSGGLQGKGFLNGTQTKYDFVPEQRTDFIFCTIGEEHGFKGSVILLVLFWAFFMRLIFLAERQRSAFTRIYGYSVATIFFFHFMVNIGMTIGLMPVIGIPLPFISYGGSSALAFTILLFIFLRLDAERLTVLR